MVGYSYSHIGARMVTSGSHPWNANGLIQLPITDPCTNHPGVLTSDEPGAVI